MPQRVTEKLSYQLHLVLPALGFLFLSFVYFYDYRNIIFSSYIGAHTLLELISIIVSFMIFIVMWATRREKMHGSSVVLGTAFLAVGFCDVFHVLGYKGMPDFFGEGGLEKAIFFWLAARFLESLALACAAFFKLKRTHLCLATYKYLSFFSIAYVVVIFYVGFLNLDLFPRTFIPGQGLTKFKIVTEYFFLLSHVLSFIILLKIKNEGTELESTKQLQGASLFGVISGICFTLYASPNDIINFLGHIFKLGNFAFIFIAILYRELRQPYELLKTARAELNLQIGNVQDLQNQLTHAQRIATFGYMAGGVVHDLNNIMAIVGMSSAKIKRIVATTPEDSKAIIVTTEQIDKNIMRSTSFIKTLLEFIKKVPNKRQILSLPTVFQDLKPSLQTLVGDKIELSVYCENNLNLMADQSELEQVVLNLCVNARDAMPSKEGKIEISISKCSLDNTLETNTGALQKGAYIQISVKDSGVGISPEVAKDIFKPFFTTKTSDKGSGLGMTTVLGIINRYRGAIQILSKPGEGSEFRIFIPVDQEDFALSQRSTETTDNL